MDRAIDSVARHAAALLFAASLVILIIGVVAAVMTHQVAAQQAAEMMSGSLGDAAQRIARIQLLIGIRDALQSASIAFGLGAIVAVLRRVGLRAIDGGEPLA